MKYKISATLQSGVTYPIKITSFRKQRMSKFNFMKDYKNYDVYDFKCEKLS